ncbi:MAG TPA: hypothetical protein O0X25_01765 [Methanocorpusculum sp.]|nr:hypothetical protein [Methanocorpusculum sp.]HJJ39724.1 hypothetical protein [Methanocorpusculum sp.]HJJ49333.1 hypothetical protein [Methanocorpusculum sp.]HJJ56623.1 hypothetical protein [Methanocorpusculum sp.]
MASATLADYFAMKEEQTAASDSRVLRAYELQNKLEMLEREMRAYQDEYKGLLSDLGDYRDQNFIIVGKTPTRCLDMSLLKANMPKVWERAEPSDTYLFNALVVKYGREYILDLVRTLDEDAFNAAKKMTLAEFDKMTGDSSEKKEFRDIAYRIENKTNKNTKIEYIGQSVMRSIIRQNAQEVF